LQAPGEVGQYNLTTEGTSDFTVTTDGYIILNTNTLNYEATHNFTFTVSFALFFMRKGDSTGDIG
jgi:hypothetical protein